MRTCDVWRMLTKRARMSSIMRPSSSVRTSSAVPSARASRRTTTAIASPRVKARLYARWCRLSSSMRAPTAGSGVLRSLRWSDMRGAAREGRHTLGAGGVDGRPARALGDGHSAEPGAGPHRRGRGQESDAALARWATQPRVPLTLPPDAIALLWRAHAPRRKRCEPGIRAPIVSGFIVSFTTSLSTWNVSFASVSAQATMSGIRCVCSVRHDPSARCAAISIGSSRRK